MESSPQEPINPYAPPKAAADTDGSTNLDLDGYAFGKILVANEEFESPLICVKLGIPITPQSEYKRKKVTVRRSKHLSKVAKIILTLMITLLISVLLLCYLNNFITSSLTLLANLSIITVTITKYYLGKPHRITFYFSEPYNRLSKRRRNIFTPLIGVLAFMTIYSFLDRSISIFYISIFSTVITSFYYYFSTARLSSKKDEGGYHYIRGVHRHLLDALPPLPLSS